MNTEYQFRIADSYTPGTLPMERLGEYIAALAKLLGERDSVHFRGVVEGSAILVADIDIPAQPKVRSRIEAVRDGRGPQDATKAFAELDEMLRKDNATGTLSGDSGAVVVQFPGRDRPEPLSFGPFQQDGTLDGQLIHIGGRDKTVHAQLRDGPVIHTGLYCTPELARRIGPYILGPILRVHGTGTWLRGGDGTWLLQRFRFIDFEILDDAPLDEVVERLRSVKGSGWGDVPDPVRALLEQRNGDGEAH
jgi:hypothetical protein